VGTDIHAVVQRRDGDHWVNIDMTWPDRPRYDHPLLQRSYNAFAILGNVRNGTGFAGVYTSDGFDPISDDRGLPDDFEGEDDGYLRCPKHARKPGEIVPVDDSDYEDPAWDCDDCDWLGDHSFTWVTAQELIDYDWEAPVRMRMVVEWPAYREWAILGGKDGFPKSWCGDVSGSRVVKIREKDLVIADADRLAAAGKSVYIEAFHSYPRREAARSLHDDVIPWLQTLGDPKDVRIVMGFDS